MSKYISLALVLLLAGSVSAAEPLQWAAPADDDLRIERLPENIAAAPSRHVESQPVSYARPLSIDSESPAPAGPAMESRSYWVDATGSRIERGLKLPLSAPGAVVRVSALHPGKTPVLDASRLSVQVDGRSLSTSRSDGGIRLLDGRDLQAQGMAVPNDTVAFKLPSGGQPESLQLQLAGVPAEQDLVVHVFEPQSRWVGTLSSTRHNFLPGQALNLNIGLSDGEEKFAADSVQAVLVSPDAAHSWPLELGEDGFELNGIVPEQLPDAGEGLYEVHAYLNDRRDNTLIRRDLKVALNVAAPTARFADRIEIGQDQGLSFGLEVEVAAAGRYQVSAQVWGSAADGSMQPLALTETAAALEPGTGRLDLNVPSDLMRNSGLTQPFELREVRLLDQGRMAVLETRSRGLTIERDPRDRDGPFDTISQQ